MTAPSATAHPSTGLRTTPGTVSLLARARRLRARAQLVNPIVAQAYLRRAAELKLEAWAQVGRLAPAGTDDSPAAA
jgi:hypothetical protein